MTEELKGQLAVVTGAARGIGAAISKQLASMGATVLLAARDKTKLTEVQSQIQSTGGIAHIVELDLLNESSISALVKTIQTQHGSRCDILVNNAGIGLIGKPLVEMDPSDWDTLMGTNLRGPYLMIRALAPLMMAAQSGHIINISSLAGRNPLPNGAAYSASKWGLNGLTYSVAEELRPHNIRVSVVAPGSVNTSFSRSDKNADKEVQPEDVAHVVAMLVTQAPQSFVSEVLLRPTQKP
ncbi:MAG TPA: SDR family oxidoreductase [Edaphobacter sp.]|nr:SDR family oxidoreductase [Edaphobacter sp.]